jgi:hypothetical protein
VLVRGTGLCPNALTVTAVQLALLTALGIGPDLRTEQTVTVQDPILDPFGIAFDGVEVGTAAPLSAAGGHAAVIELLATTATLGGVPVSDEGSESAALEVLASAADWWYSPDDLVFGRAQDWLAPQRCNYNGCMSVSLTIRDLPEATRDMLRQRAEARRQSLNSYIVDLLEREAGLPTMSEWADMVESRARLAGSSDAAVEAVRELRDAL